MKPLSREERQQRVRNFLTLIAPTDELESLTEDVAFNERLATRAVSDQEQDSARRAIAALRRNEELSEDMLGFAEAIIIPGERPVVDIQGDQIKRPEPPFAHFFDDPGIRDRVNSTLRSIGRIELPDHPLLPYAGTGFLVGSSLLMTNRHVVAIFGSGLGRGPFVFRTSAGADFQQEVGQAAGEGRTFRIRQIVMVHPYWDMALVRVDGLDDSRPALTLMAESAETLVGREVAVIGYPGLDNRNDLEVQRRIFRNVFYKKRMLPGKVRAKADYRSFDNTVSAMTHDASTLGGNSGSCLIEVQTGNVVGLHFAGEYLISNYAVAAYDLARDQRVVDAGVRFDRSIAGPVAWEPSWRSTESAPPAPVAVGMSTPEPHAGSTIPAASAPGSAALIRIPIELTVSVGTPVSVGVKDEGRKSGSTTSGSDVSPEGIERLVEPYREQDYAGRPGYDDHFLGADLPLPEIKAEARDLLARMDNGSAVLPYEHFSIVMHKQRRLALFTASNVDASPRRKRPEPRRKYSRDALAGIGENDQEKWFTDPRIPELHQLPDRFFTNDRGAFDKGHIIRREDVAWGDTYAELRRANGDTYHTTNCSPQVAGFNRSNLGGDWGELENHVLAQARTERLSLFAGPVLADGDREFQGRDDQGRVKVRIPTAYWKVVVTRSGNGFQTFAFLLEQDLSQTRFTEGFEFVVGPWTKRMMTLAALEAKVRFFRFPTPLHESDQSGEAAGEALRIRSGTVLRA